MPQPTAPWTGERVHSQQTRTGTMTQQHPLNPNVNRTEILNSDGEVIATYEGGDAGLRSHDMFIDADGNKYRVHSRTLRLEQHAKRCTVNVEHLVRPFNN